MLFLCDIILSSRRDTMNFNRKEKIQTLLSFAVAFTLTLIA